MHKESQRCRLGLKERKARIARFTTASSQSKQQNSDIDGRCTTQQNTLTWTRCVPVYPSADTWTQAVRVGKRTTLSIASVKSLAKLGVKHEAVITSQRRRDVHANGQRDDRDACKARKAEAQQGPKKT
uniref:Uncharacterized protein n=2 Tax=Chrysotila carterae TaxID=13221 RepID=A0A7S4BJS9_CHRCT